MEYNRRQFLKIASNLACIGAVSKLVSCKSIRELLQSKHIIDKIELFRYDVNTERHFSFGTWNNRQHIFLRITSGTLSGWSEVLASTNNPALNPLEWGAYLKEFKGLEINEAYKKLTAFQFTGSTLTNKNLELLELALIDLVGKITEKPALEILGLNERTGVAGVYCILNDNVEGVRTEIKNAHEQKFDSHIKIKMFGNKTLDLSLLKAVKEHVGNETIIISDVNGGYNNWNNIDELAEILCELRDNGLYGIEDPAKLNTEQWIELQSKIGKLNLIPDEPMRPSWKGYNKIDRKMGRIFNLHPCAMGSIQFMSKLALKIKSFDGRIMIGDASFVGPGCTIWQQIAIGAGAEWVEAIEKAGDSDNYLSCVVKKSTYRDINGFFNLDLLPGFGIDIDTERLKRVCKLYKIR